MNKFGLIVRLKKLSKCYTFTYYKLGHFPLLYKSMVPRLKVQAINSFFWILVRMIAIHHCAKEQYALLNGVQRWAPYCQHQSTSNRDIWRQKVKALSTHLTERPWNVDPHELKQASPHLCVVTFKSIACSTWSLVLISKDSSLRGRSPKLSSKLGN